MSHGCRSWRCHAPPDVVLPLSGIARLRRWVLTVKEWLPGPGWISSRCSTSLDDAPLTFRGLVTNVPARSVPAWLIAAFPTSSV